MRKQNNYSQDYLAYYAGIARSTLGNIETAKNDIVLSKVNKIAKAFNMNLSELFEGVD